MMRFIFFSRSAFLLYLLTGSALFYVTNTYAAGDDSVLFRACASCHVVTDPGPARTGPQLSRLFERGIASLDGYNYSDALRTFGGENSRWDKSTLDRFLASPGALVPGTSMAYAGIKDSSKRERLVNWLLEVTAEASPAGDLSGDPEVQKIIALDADPDYGEYLAAECLTCHQSNGTAGGAVPVIAGMDSGQFVRALLDYKNKVRSNPVMVMTAGSLGEDELAALAVFFAKLGE